MVTDWQAYLMTQGAVFDAGQLMGFSQAPPAQLDADTVCVLSQQGLISVAGVDRQKFLQGQISTNMTQLAALHHGAGVACSPKGRMYTTFRILDTGERYLLAMNAGLSQSTIETLKKYAGVFPGQSRPAAGLSDSGLSGVTIAAVLNTVFPAIPLPTNGEVVQVADGSYLLQVPGICTSL